ncbi:MAG: hypothetical protein HOV80_18175 [Polyangiaceae bacterium]|nr:hypothetical protein [Polyangiaceae bacterium]
MVRTVTAYAALACLLASSASCSDDGAATGGGGATTGTGDATASTGDTTASTASTTIATTGNGGEGGEGGAGGSTFCAPGAEQPCYTGPSGTEGVGICQSGIAICLEDGSGFGSCEGEVLPARETCMVAADEDCDGSAPNCAGSHLWSKSFGDVADDQGEGVASDPAGNVLVAGSFETSVDFGGGPLTNTPSTGPDVFVAKLDPDGNHIFSKQFGEASGDFAYFYVIDAATDSAGNLFERRKFVGTLDCGGGPLTSAGIGDIFVAKLDPDGNHVFSKRFGNAQGQAATSVAIDAAGDVVVVGSFYGTIDFGGGPIANAGNMDAFLVKLDADGNHILSKSFGDASDQTGTDVSVDSAGNILITGSFGGSIDFGGGALLSAGGYDVYVAKLDTDGNHVLSQRFGNAREQYARHVLTDAAGNVILAGVFMGTMDFGGGPIASAGSFEGYVAKLDPAGNHVSSRRYGGLGEVYSQGLAVDPSDNVLLAGYYELVVDFGGGPHTTEGDNDVFVAKLEL